jgi:hypothetical protein
VESAAALRWYGPCAGVLAEPHHETAFGHLPLEETMRTHTSPPATWALAFLALGAAALIGCSNLFTAPDTQSAGATPEINRPAAAHGSLLGGAGDLLGDPVGTTTSLLDKTVQTISGSDGGKVTAGRFTVHFPPGAVSGDGEVTVEVPDTTVMRVDLHIKNAPNRFEVPVTLEVSFAGFDRDPLVDPARYKIFWLDEAAGRWRMLETHVDLERRTVSTELLHFSTYAVFEGKAGW